LRQSHFWTIAKTINLLAHYVAVRAQTTHLTLIKIWNINTSDISETHICYPTSVLFHPIKFHNHKRPYRNRIHRTSHTRQTTPVFYVLLTVHLGSVLVNSQLDAQFFFRIYLFQFSTCFGHPVLIIRRINCINTTFGICQLCR
jgi:hypothetical protein